MQTATDPTVDYLSIGSMLKATPREEGGERFVYLEASNEALDQQNEIILSKALEDSAGFFKKFGNLDLDHFSQIGKPNPAKGWAGIADYEKYEIGHPVDVTFKGGRTFVKGRINSGTGPAAEQANLFWSSLTELNPPKRWYPSVGGAILSPTPEELKILRGKGDPIRIQKVRWNNIGFSKTPVNSDVPTVATVPFGVLAKSWGPAGLDLSKALEAGYGTDSATLSGGGALRRQSLQGAPVLYQDFQGRLAADIRAKRTGANPSVADLIDFAAEHYSLGHDRASEWIERFMRDLKTLVERNKS